MGLHVGLTIARSKHCGLVAWAGTAGARAIRVEVANGVIPGDEGGGIGQEVSAIGEEDHHGERVAKQEFTDASNE